jgi:hypothetical protein
MASDAGDSGLPTERRILLYAPIIHGEADLGSLAPPIRHQSSLTLGEEE